MKNRRWIISLVLILALTLTACTPGNDQNNNNGENQQMEEETPAPNTDEENNTDDNTNQGENAVNTNASYDDIKLTPEEAFNKYMDEYTEAIVEKLELDLDDGSYYYKVEGHDNENEYELKINPLDGTIINEERDDTDDDDDDGEITVEDVRKIEELVDNAIEDAGNDYKVEEWILEWDDGRVTLEIDLIDGNDEIEYKYDVKTGELIEKDN